MSGVCGAEPPARLLFVTYRLELREAKKQDETQALTVKREDLEGTQKELDAAIPLSSEQLLCNSCYMTALYTLRSISAAGCLPPCRLLYCRAVSNAPTLPLLQHGQGKAEQT